MCHKENMGNWRIAKISQGLCGTCGKNPLAEGRKDCLQCKERRAKRQKERYHVAKQNKLEYASLRREKFKAVGVCSRCGKNDPAHNRLMCEDCIQKNKTTRDFIKDEVFAQYGGYECSCCGESVKEFLTLDHINNDGSKHRKTIRGSAIYNWAKQNNFPPIFQVLCFNCNCGRARNGGVCPHVESASKTQESYHGRRT